MEDAVVDTEKMMQHYSRLSANKLTETTVRAFTSRVQDGVRHAQEKADIIVNALTSKQRAPDFQAARRALATLAKSDSTIASHWGPFIREVASLLPPPAEGELAEAEDQGAIQMRLDGLADLIDRLITPLPTMNGAELRDVAMFSEKIEESIQKEMAKRGLKLSKANAEAVSLSLLEAQLRAVLDNQPVGFVPHPMVAELVTVFDTTNKALNSASVALGERDAKLAEFEKKLMGSEEQAEREQLRLQLEQADERIASLRGFESQVAALKKSNGELEHELAELKKQHKKSASHR